MTDGLTVWVVEVHHGHGEEARVSGVYESREAAFEGLRTDFPAMTVYVDGKGLLRGRPRAQPHDLLHGALHGPQRVWAHGHPMPVQGRRQQPEPEAGPDGPVLKQAAIWTADMGDPHGPVRLIDYTDFRPAGAPPLAEPPR